jgi:ABC-2 type transport system ATP-binding protein
MSPSASIIDVEHLTKRYKGAKTNAVDDISFTVREGEFFAFLGPNGAGKTTTISIITTTLNATSGSVTINGFDLKDDPQGLRRSIGVIFQTPSLDGGLTLEENVRLHCVLYGLYSFRPSYSMMPVGYRERLRQLLELVDLWDLRFSKVKSLSGGMQRKLEIVRSLFHRPKVVFLDEPTAGLDPLSRRNVWNYLHDVRRAENTTIFLTTHYLDEAEDADRVAIIHQGGIKLCDTPSAVKRQLVDEMIVMDASDRNALKQELTMLGIDFHENEHIVVTLHQKTAQDVIQAIHTPLSVLTIEYPTLEEAYIRFLNLRHETA